MKIFGGWSRAEAQKSFSFFARSVYGKGNFDYELFPAAVQGIKLEREIIQQLAVIEARKEDFRFRARVVEARLGQEAGHGRDGV